jgi:hypothetical protein
MFTFEIEGCKFGIHVSDHAIQRMRQRNVDMYAAYGSIVALGEDLLDMSNKEEFCVMDKELDISVCCAVIYERDSNGMPFIEINITTVLDNSMFFVKDGVRVFQLSL